jgi:NAD(P)-dependent dehydrogenase (short-subunit alcohol dehydrogenase family)
VSGEGVEIGIVTGAAHGIGLALVQRLARRGMRVAAVDVAGDALMAAPLPDGTLRLVRDLADDPAGWVAEVETQLGVPTVLVNNVATTDGRAFMELPLDAVRRSLDVTLFGTWALTRAVVDGMIRSGSPGAVVFNLSLHARRVRMYPDYSVAKAGLLMLMRELADELGPYGIRVNAVSPGMIDTWFHRAPDADELLARSAALVPLGRVGEPDDVAKAIEFLIDTDASGYVTGTDLKVDGGLDQFNWLHHLYGSAKAERERTNAPPHDLDPDPDQGPRAPEATEEPPGESTSGAGSG